MFSAFPNRFKYRQNACFRDIVFNKNSLQLQIVSNSVRMQTKNERQNPCCVGSLLQYSSLMLTTYDMFTCDTVTVITRWNSGICRWFLLCEFCWIM